MQIALAGWSLHRRFYAKQLELLDFPRVVREEFGLTLAELNSPFFDATDDAYLAAIVEAARAEGVEIIHISVDGQGDLAAVDEAERAEAVRKHKAWFAIAKAVGSPSFRGNMGGGSPHTSEQLAACKKSFIELAEEARRTGVAMLIENHGGISGAPEAVVEVIEAAGPDAIGTCPDFGNFPAEIRYEGLERIAPYARVAHAKLYDFLPDGEEVTIDVGRCLKILRDAGFDGVCSVEFEGKMDDHEGVAKSIALLRRYL